MVLITLKRIQTTPVTGRRSGTGIFKWRMNVVTINRPIKVSASRVRVIQTYEFCWIVRCDVELAAACVLRGDQYVRGWRCKVD